MAIITPSRFNLHGKGISSPVIKGWSFTALDDGTNYVDVTNSQGNLDEAIGIVHLIIHNRGGLDRTVKFQGTDVFIDKSERYTRVQEDVIEVTVDFNDFFILPVEPSMSRELINSTAEIEVEVPDSTEMYYTAEIEPE